MFEQQQSELAESRKAAASRWWRLLGLTILILSGPLAAGCRRPVTPRTPPGSTAQAPAMPPSEPDERTGGEGPIEDGTGGTGIASDRVMGGALELAGAAPRRGAAWRAYVADAVCAECHAEIAERYAVHPMGRSISANSPERSWSVGEAQHNPFTAGGFEYSVATSPQGLAHRQIRRASDGSVVVEVAHTPTVVVGSGQHGQSFVVQQDDYLFMSPITWYSEREVWDLSPGYERRNSEFFRPVVSECVFCHANRVEPVAGALNRVREPSRVTESIGCQRCHGPGEQHVFKHRTSTPVEEVDATIVNPGRLEPALREAVCQQCHLSGLVRLVRSGSAWHDFRPGQPLEQTMLAYAVVDGKGQGTGEPNAESTTRFVGHAEQMLASRCYVASDGAMGCITCHDPHGRPASEERAEFYRQRCVACHAADGPRDCGLAVDDESRRSAGNNCVQCHMPREPNQVRHTAITDHRILRRPTAAGAERNGGAGESGEVNEGEKARVQVPAWAADLPLRAVVVGTDHRSESQQRRDMAVGLVMAKAERPELVTQSQLRLAAGWLEASLQDGPQDLDGQLALGQIRLELDDLAGARELFRRAVAESPESELAWVWAARTLAALDQLEPAAASWRRAQQLNPHMANYWYELALVEGRLGRWQETLRLSREAAERFPTSMGARQLLIQAYLQLGDRPSAETAFQFMRRFQPPGFDRVDSWYRDQTR